MKMMKMIPIMMFIFFQLLFSFSSSQPFLFDFCVANFQAPYGPAGYSCKDPSSVNANDFYGRAVLSAANTENRLKAGETTAFVHQIPALNGLRVSMARVDVEPNGIVPIHTHPDATEVLAVLEGNMTAGLISSNNTVYMKTLSKGDVFVFPRGLLHFQLNSGKYLSVGIAVYSSENPNTQFFDYAVFKSNLSSQIVSDVTFINILEVRRLKTLFGGSG